MLVVLAGTVTPFSAGAFVVIGGFFLILGLLDLVNGLRSKSWDAVSGEIRESRMFFRGRRWIVVIRYRYSIEGLTFEGDRLGFGRLAAWVTQAAAERAVAMYPKGRVVTILVSPLDRSEAVIEPGVGLGVVVMCVGGALFAAAGLAGLDSISR